MKSAVLTVRNLTATSIEVKKIERRQNTSCFQTFHPSLIINRDKSSQSPAKIKSGGLNKQEEKLSLNISPFKSRSTDTRVNSNENISLTFLVDGQLYQVRNIAVRSPYSNTLTCLSSNPRFRLIAIFHPSLSHLAILSVGDPESWMSKLSDDIPLSALSIPGTHNSPTFYTALPTVRCQAVGVKSQLENGVRFLDIRVQPEDAKDLSNDQLILVHSAFPISLTGNKYLRNVINTVEAFLDAHPNETVIISLKREGVGKSTDQHLSKILYHHYVQRDQNRWFTENRIPTLGEVRKKLVLIRRFSLDESLKEKNGGSGWAIDAERWPDNCADGICADGNIRIQDFYEVSAAANIKEKMTYSVEQLIRSAQFVFDFNSATSEIPKHPFFVNFLSGSSFWRANCWPDRVAAKVNPHIIQYLCLNHYSHKIMGAKFSDKVNEPVGNGSTGIVVCDWLGKNNNWDLVNCILSMNSVLQML